MTVFTRLALGLASLLLAACQGQESSQRLSARDSVDAPAANAAVTLSIEAAPDLNSVNGLANSCAVLILQAKSLAELQEIMADPGRVKPLFISAAGDKNLLQVDRYVMMPGQRSVLHLDRAAGARHIAVLAGYYPQPDAEQMSIVSIPVSLTSTGWWFKSWEAQLAPLSVNVMLDKSRLHVRNPVANDEVKS